VIQCDQTSVLATSIILHSEGEKCDDRYKGQSSFLLQVMSTILIVLVVLFLLGGGGWGDISTYQATDKGGKESLVR